ncbi:putative peptidoglycan lipid II flippase [Friedmanniella luteola]|uniref:Putative peptidoglycan lipid II flippase n=1 Tax=Friedmanniella luteola TaxID=546871 RepID=A0A1H1QVD8_9ACTN|nr:lipid II flippase MurJ [Friedmanniella luteola]SDS27337.1 putative peptidoglycan lipid II flippase [Friedmanniella luteola]
MRAGAGSVALSLAGLTLAARLVGFGRSVVFSKTVGDTCLGDAYNAANTLPNLLFEVVAGGVLAGVVVPVVARHVAAGRGEQTTRTVSALVTWTLLVLTPAALVALLGAPLYARLLASPGCPGSAGTVAALLVVFAPQVWLYGLAVVSAGVLQAHDRFLAAATAPLVSSLVVVAAYLAFAAVAPAAARDDLGALNPAAAAVLGWGTTLGVLALAACTLVPLARLGLRVRPRLRFADGDRGVILRIAGAGLAGLVLQQLSVLLISWAAQRSGDPGALTRFTWANALYLLPYAVLVAPLLQTVFPRLSRAAGTDADGGRTAVRAVLTRTAPSVVLLAWLGAALLAGTAVPVARVFVLGPGSGRTDALAGPITAFAPAVVGFALLGLATRTLLAQHRARAAGLATGLAWGAVIVAVAGLRLVVPPTALVPVLAGSVSVGMAVGAVVGWAALHRQGVAAGLARPLLVGLTAAVVAVLACWWPAARLGDAGLTAALLGGAGLAVLGTAVFAGVAALLDRSLLTGLGRLRGRDADADADADEVQRAGR